MSPLNNIIYLIWLHDIEPQTKSHTTIQSNQYAEKAIDTFLPECLRSQQRRTMFTKFTRIVVDRKLGPLDQR